MDHFFPGKSPVPFGDGDPDATADFPSPSSMTLISGNLKLRVGVGR